MALITTKEAFLIDKFRENVEDILTEDQTKDNYFLVRWLRARNLNLDLAEEMLRNAVQWRNDNSLDKPRRISLLKDPYFSKNFPLWIDGIDRDGRPVHTSHFGKWDARKLLREGRADQFVSYITESYEEVLRAVRRSAELHPPKNGDPPITQYVCISDWKDFAYSQLFHYQSVQTFLKIATYYESYYPETLHSCYVINCPAPYLTQTILGLVGSVASSKTMAKIKLFITDREEWQKEILKVVSPEQIRPRFGGTKVDDFNPFI